MSLQIAQAAVDDATIHFDKLYSYCIPPRLNDKVWPGSMVLVPFGRGNKPRMAVVLSVAELPDKKIYQLAFLTPGIKPFDAISRN